MSPDRRAVKEAALVIEMCYNGGQYTRECSILLRGNFSVIIVVIAAFRRNDAPCGWYSPDLDMSHRVSPLLQAFWVTGQVVKFPLNQYATVTLTDRMPLLQRGQADRDARREPGSHVHDQGQRHGGLVLDRGVNQFI